MQDINSEAFVPVFDRCCFLPIFDCSCDEGHMSGFWYRWLTFDRPPMFGAFLVAPAEGTIMSTRGKILSTALAGVLISGAGVMAAGPAVAAPAVAPVIASSMSVPTMTMGQMTITITDFAYSGIGTVSPGSQITVTNTDTEVHTVTADNGAFDVTIPGGETVTFAAPADAGTYSFFCKFHANMEASLTVAAAAAPAPAAPTTPAPAPAPAAAQPGTGDSGGMDDMEGMDQMGTVPRGGADTGTTQVTGGSLDALLLGGGLVLAALAGSTYAVRRRTTSQ
ncbi:plastocyanin [Arthrobacter sp. CAN_A2]|uniref:cupredoxin domain-containing protein n=1 Tax=Arthrobacter sp. CAN_A2 TaxID=2787718 RepID=UPI0018EFE10F